MIPVPTCPLGNMDLVNVLLWSGASCRPVDHKGSKAINKAVEKGFKGIACILVTAEEEENKSFALQLWQRMQRIRESYKSKLVYLAVDNTAISCGGDSESCSIC